MIVFRPWSFALSEVITRYLQEDSFEFCELTPGYLGGYNVYVDQDVKDVGFAEVCGCGIYRGMQNRKAVYFSFPFGGGDKAEALRMLAEYCRESSLPMRFYPVGEAEIGVLKDVLGGEWRAVEQPESADYVYYAKNLASPEYIRLVRKMLRKFEALGPWCARDAVPADIPAMLGLLETWTAARGGADGADHDGCRDAVRGIGLKGTLSTVVEQNGRLVAFSIGRHLNPDMLISEFEKSDPQVPGACQASNRAFVSRWAGNATFVNLSSDLGIIGLRMAKRKYRPCRMVRKFFAEKVA